MAIGQMIYAKGHKPTFNPLDRHIRDYETAPYFFADHRVNAAVNIPLISDFNAVPARPVRIDRRFVLNIRDIREYDHFIKFISFR